MYASPRDEFVARAAALLRAARRAGVCVVHVKVSFRPGLPEVSARNKLLAAIKSSPGHRSLFTDPDGAIDAVLGPERGDIIVTKCRVSAFAGTDLLQVLRAREVRTLVLFGISTSGAVLATLLEAADADYELVVVSDCCADLDPTLHDALISRLIPTHAAVVSASEVVEALTAVSSDAFD
jgi:nicotinamidase-related amidase